MLKQHTWVILRRLGMDSMSLRWFGSSSLAIQYQPLYTIVNEKDSTIVDCWDGVNLKFTCRRILSAYVMRMWEEILSIVGAINLTKEPDLAVWNLNSNGLYYMFVVFMLLSAFGGVQQIHTPVV